MTYDIVIDEFLPIVKGDVRAHVNVTISGLISIRGVTVIEPSGKASVEMPALHSLVDGFPSTFHFIAWRDQGLEQRLNQIILAHFAAYREQLKSRIEEARHSVTSLRSEELLQRPTRPS